MKGFPGWTFNRSASIFDSPINARTDMLTDEDIKLVNQYHLTSISVLILNIRIALLGKTRIYFQNTRYIIIYLDVSSSSLSKKYDGNPGLANIKLKKYIFRYVRVILMGNTTTWHINGNTFHIISCCIIYHTAFNVIFCIHVFQVPTSE